MIDVRELIPEGRENAINRHNLVKSFVDAGLLKEDGKDLNRLMMEWIHLLRKDTVIISSGKGYYRPRKDELEEINNYIAKEEHRLKEISSNLIYAKKYREDIRAGRI